MNNDLKLKKALPANRNYQQVRNHYIVEKSIADKLKQSSRDERKVIYREMYDELFNKVPDHPRLNRREDPDKTNKLNKIKLALISKNLNKSQIFVEFAPGDCLFSDEVTKHVKFVYGVDISNQMGKIETQDNFELIVYDGYNLNGIYDDSVDLVFSDQLIEHFHPDDLMLHFKLVKRILKTGGSYFFQTPHAHSGPHDVSQYFSNVPEGFHLKEWTFVELRHIILKLGFSKVRAYWSAKGYRIRLPYVYFRAIEQIFKKFRHNKYVKIIFMLLIPRISIFATK